MRQRVPAGPFLYTMTTGCLSWYLTVVLPSRWPSKSAELQPAQGAGRKLGGKFSSSLILSSGIESPKIQDGARAKRLDRRAFARCPT